MVVGSATGRIVNVVATWPGSTHDSRVWKTSAAYAAIRSQDEFSIAGKKEVLNIDGLVLLVFILLQLSSLYHLGDSAYGMSKFLVKPFLHPESPGERRFNHRLCAIRTKATENIIGFLKRRSAHYNQ